LAARAPEIEGRVVPVATVELMRAIAQSLQDRFGELTLRIGEAREAA
jgi:hypothetical protein